MQDPTLDVQMQEVALLQSDLKSFRDIIVSTLNTEVVVPENETRLTQLKESVPAKAEKLYEDLYEEQDDTAVRIVGQVTDLALLIRFTDLEKRKLLESWHKYYLKLHFMMGRLKSRKEKLESLNVAAMKLRKTLLRPMTIIVVLAIIVFLVFIYLSKKSF